VEFVTTVQLYWRIDITVSYVLQLTAVCGHTMTTVQTVMCCSLQQSVATQ